MTFLKQAKGRLNKQQYEAVVNTKGPQLILAGAGTGKTTTLVNRVAHLISEGTEPADILLLTFTKKAAKEMLDRACALLDNSCKQVSGGTFHGFANVILRKYAPKLGYKNNFSILDPGDVDNFIGAVKSYTIPEHKLKNKYYPKTRTITSIISKSINTGKDFEEIIGEDYPHFVSEDGEKHNKKELLTMDELVADITLIKKNFEATKKRSNAMDYDDILVNLQKLLTEHPDIREKLSNKYKYILVDEYQDTNKIQAHISCMLASTHGNITVVGDDCQTIYSWRGANHKNILDFPSIFGKDKTKIYYLIQNYRSTNQILNISNGLIDTLNEKYEKELFSERDSKQLPIFTKFKNADDEAEFTCKEILKLREDGDSLDDIAVLIRSGYHSFRLEARLNAHNVPYKKFGGLKFTELAHIKDLVAVLKVIHNPLDNISLFRLLNLIPGVGNKTALKIIEGVSANGVGHLLTYQDKKFGEDMMGLFNLVQEKDWTLKQQISKARSFYEQYFKTKYEDFQARENDINEFENIGLTFQLLSDFLNALSLDDTILKAESVNEIDTADECLTISTIHSAKGLEWNNVFMIHLVDGMFPSSKSMKDEQTIEEEKRLMYVGLTRPRNLLYLLSHTSYTHSTMERNSTSSILSGIENLGELVEEREATADLDSDNLFGGGRLDSSSISPGFMGDIDDYFS